MSKRFRLYTFSSGLLLFGVAMPTFSQQETNPSIFHKEVFLNSESEDILSYKIGNKTIAEGELTEGLKTGEWDFYYKNGKKRFSTHFIDNKLDGEYNSYYESGEVLCNAHFSEGNPTKKWTSYYKEGSVQGEISWLANHLPSSTILYFENGLIAFDKEFEYEKGKVIINIQSFYENSIPFESYTLEINLEEFESIKYDLTLSTEPHLLFSETGSLTSFYERKYNSGKTWISCEFYDGKLLDVFEQNKPDGSSILGWQGEGTGIITHFHHFKDTAARVYYEDGIKHGSLKYFHSNNNTYKTGAYLKGSPANEWTLYSSSGKIRQQYLIEDSVIKWTFFGPKNKKEEEFRLYNGVLEGKGFKFNFFGDTTAYFSYEGGLLQGKFEKHQAGSLLRSGFYLNGEQTGNWLTHGQFNPVSHKTVFGNKQVIYDSQNIPSPEFSFDPKIQLPHTPSFDYKAAETYNFEFFMYSQKQFTQLLFVTPDSDEIWGTTWIGGKINEAGFIEDQTCLKSPSAKMVSISSQLISSFDLFLPSQNCGFPVPFEGYLVLEHYRE